MNQTFSSGKLYFWTLLAVLAMVHAQVIFNISNMKDIFLHANMNQDTLSFYKLSFISKFTYTF